MGADIFRLAVQVPVPLPRLPNFRLTLRVEPSTLHIA